MSPLYRCINVNFRVDNQNPPPPVRTARNCTYFALFHIFSLEMNFDKDFSKLFFCTWCQGRAYYGPYGHRKFIQSNTLVKTFCKLGNLCYQLLWGKSFFSGAGIVGLGWELQAWTVRTCVCNECEWKFFRRISGPGFHPGLYPYWPCLPTHPVFMKLSPSAHVFVVRVFKWVTSFCCVILMNLRDQICKMMPVSIKIYECCLRRRGK